MRVSTRYYISTLIGTLMVIAAAGTAIYWNHRAVEVQEELHFTENIQQNAQEIAYLTNAYLLFQFPSQLELLQQKSRDIANNLSSLTPDSESEKHLIDDALENGSKFLAVLDDIQTYTRENPTVLGDLAYVRTSWSRMQGQSQAMVTDVIQLHFAIHRKSDTLRQINNNVILSLFLVFGVLIFINASFINRRILASIKILKKGPEAVGTGNLDYVIQVKGNDEFAELCREFNKMTENLKNLTTSKAELEAVNLKLAEANRQLSLFANAASHDLREPLRMVTSFSQLLEKKYKDRLGEDADEYIGYIVSNAARMQSLIDDLLAYSRAGFHVEPFDNVNMETVFREVAGRLKDQIDKTGAVLTSDPLPSIQADGPLLTLVLQHLIENAIKFRGSETPRIHVSAKKDDEKKEWVFSVKDNGIGIDPMQFPHLFVLFSQLQPRGSYSGTGTGLAIVKKIIESHGGRVYVESEQGRGSTFFFVLPFVPEGKR